MCVLLLKISIIIIPLKFLYIFVREIEMKLLKYGLKNSIVAQQLQLQGRTKCMFAAVYG